MKVTNEQKLKYLNYVVGILSSMGADNIDYVRIRDLVYKGDYKRYEVDNYNSLAKKLNERYNMNIDYILDHFREIKISQILDIGI